MIKHQNAQKFSEVTNEWILYNFSIVKKGQSSKPIFQFCINTLKIKVIVNKICEIELYDFSTRHLIQN